MAQIMEEDHLVLLREELTRLVGRSVSIRAVKVKYLFQFGLVSIISQ